MGDPTNYNKAKAAKTALDAALATATGPYTPSKTTLDALQATAKAAADALAGKIPTDPNYTALWTADANAKKALAAHVILHTPLAAKYDAAKKLADTNNKVISDFEGLGTKIEGLKSEYKGFVADISIQQTKLASINTQIALFGGDNDKYTKLAAAVDVAQEEKRKADAVVVVENAALEVLKTNVTTITSAITALKGFTYYEANGTELTEVNINDSKEGADNVAKKISQLEQDLADKVAALKGLEATKVGTENGTITELDSKKKAIADAKENLAKANAALIYAKKVVDLALTNLNDFK